MRLLFFTAVLMCTVAGAQIHRSDSVTERRYDIHVDGLRQAPWEMDHKIFTSLKLLGVGAWQGRDGQVGAPEIPTLRLYVEGSGPIEVTARSQHTERISSPLKPVLAPVVRKRGARPKLVVNSAAYAWSPPRTVPYEISPVGYRRGTLIRLITLFPVAYDGPRGEIRWTDTFHVRVGGDPLASLVQQPGPETYGFVVGAPFASSPSLARLIAFKESLGYHVERVVVGGTVRTPEDIRARLQSWYHDARHPLRHALLIGGHREVPAKRSDRLEGDGVTDHFYRCLDDPYESDIGAPDIGVGRFSAGSESELAVLVDKNIRYERGDFTDAAWLKRWSFIGTDDSTPGNSEMVENTHDWAMQTYTNPLGFLGRFPHNPQAGGDRLYAIGEGATSSDVMRAIQDGRAFVNYAGHGSATQWSGPVITQGDVGKLAHPEALPFISSQACDTAHFTVDSFGETWHRHARGAIAFWGSMDVLFWDPADDLIGRSEYDAIFREGRLAFSEIIYYAIGEGWKFLGGKGKSPYYWETYVLLGDPALRLRTEVPRNVGLRVDPLSAGQGDLVARVTDGAGLALPGIRVGIAQVGGSLRSAVLSGLDGTARVTLEGPAQSGNRFTVSAQGDNLKMAFTEVRVP